jgi:hypothetical protein
LGSRAMPFAQLLRSGPRLSRGTVSMLGHAAFPDHELRMKSAAIGRAQC